MAEKVPFSRWCSILETCFQLSIKLMMNWVPMSENDVTDYLGKIISTSLEFF
jgi:hypothetical protein